MQMEKIEGEPAVIVPLETAAPAERESTGRKSTSDIRRFQWSNLPASQRLAVVTLYLAHYFLLITSVSLILYKRLREHEEIEKIESLTDAKVKSALYVMFGLVYAKYNFEIINFIYFVLFAKFFYETYVAKSPATKSD